MLVQLYTIDVAIELHLTLIRVANV